MEVFDLLARDADVRGVLEAAEQERKLRAARQTLIGFTEYTMPKYRAAPHHHAIARVLERVLFSDDLDRVIIATAPRHGKALAVDTPIPTPTGWRSIGDLRRGDSVFAADGSVCRVVAVSSVWRDRPVYRVTDKYGESIVADAEHEWLARTDRKTGAVKIRTTEQLASRGERGRKVRLYPDQPALKTPMAELPVDPYVLGAWLGDGKTQSSAMCSQDTEIVDRLVAAEGGEVSWYGERNSVRHFRIGPHFRRGALKKDTLQARLRSLGVIGDKHIPRQYLRASVAQRMNLLNGLIDTDGYVAADGQVEFCSTNKALAQNVCELVWSLGAVASVIEGRATFRGVDHGPKYRVMFYMKDAAWLPRKRVRTKDAKNKGARYVDIEPCGRADTVCIQVDHPSSMFLAGRTMLPTHNSELCSRRFPAFALGHFPHLEFLSASAGQTLASAFGGEVRDIVASPEYELLFPETTMKADDQSKGRWRTSQGGAYASFGVGGRPIGFGGDIVMIDDPFGSMEDADSKTIRDKVHRWYTNTIYNRLQPGGKIIIISHRMHEDDLTGFLLREEQAGGDQWFMLCLEAELGKAAADYLGRKPGEALWPEAYPLEALARIKKASGTRAYSALYMQDPRAAADGILKADWFNYWPSGEELPVFDFIIQSYDTAFTDQTKNDPTACVTLGVFTVPTWMRREFKAPKRGVMIIDAWDEHIDYSDLRKRIKDEWEDSAYGQPFSSDTEDGPMLGTFDAPLVGAPAKDEHGRQADLVLIEDKGSGAAVQRELKRGARVPVRTYNPGRRGKTERLNAISPYVENGLVWVIGSGRADRKGREVDWMEDCLYQLTAFRFEGSVPHDDYVDAFTQAMDYLVRNNLIEIPGEETVVDEDDEEEGAGTANPYAA